MELYQSSWLILFAPLFAFVVIIFGTRMLDLFSRPRAATVSEESHGHATEAHGEESHGHHHNGLDDDEDPKVPQLTIWAKASAWVAMLFMVIACGFSWFLLINALTSNVLPDQGTSVFHYEWFAVPGNPLKLEIAFHIDRLAIAMMVVVTTIALLVMIYSQGYMERSAGYARFYSYLSLFAFSMLVIVFAANFLVMFIGWELVGLSSYLLIGFWINKTAKPDEQRPSPASASLQAFVMNRIGDVGFIIGIMILFTSLGTFDFHTLFANAGHMDKTLLTIAMICVFCGAIGKSAQVPLHSWLPSAMEGPTPVSALIHAATMVAAGVYMVARTFPLYAAAEPAAFTVVAWIGGLTAFFAATIALVQRDFKRVLAFSTISQLGYMFVGLGVAGLAVLNGHGPANEHEALLVAVQGALSEGGHHVPYYGVGAGMFHLFTHAFFKALLFLGAGSVIHALHHVTHREMQDMRFMGGLAKKMPITAITWLVAVLAISGFPFTSGFYSKETIIGLAYETNQWGLYVLTLVTAGLTAFYMLRAYILAFGGRDGKFGGLWGGTYRGVGEPHESPFTMTIPLIILAIPSIIAGYWTGFFPFVQPQANPLDIPHMLSLPDTWIGVLVSFIGLAVAYVMYCRVEPAKLESFVRNNSFVRGLHAFLFNRWFIDDLYAAFVKYIVIGFFCNVAQAIDTYVVDGIVNGVAFLITGLGQGIRRLQTGRVQAYMVGFFGGVAVLAIVVIVLVTRGY
ncbi:NAD(P)H-quinone oxidoreductase subunit 5 [Thermosporothrix hazakensis]|jgi:NADH:ubiquinone oxidoreductase subunit 5 (subunit L)/multisubunit Na+/H+ antiporter MnhA subunit|uniref:NAD(P)H-quinone oxidoreductase subunit 5 n=2 Tax=Thermosporothrix TaxID=768650 RepID=A0A326UW85_THEHA|nr:proton-conducting transporter membrane subunit [Thermosporothrix hazakensis]PZW36633.1 NAD(P)H-quinone oxidoreductase subunit 5 [Thermosporothrix hazakensis]BBH89101.1 oxidoreductase [Thermosporothrix sp. COM3]GCE47284.1 oxidoreductase [Thermosporothrix hazakensis]